MAVNIEAKQADREAALEFLRSQLPFRELDPSTIGALAEEFRMDFFPKDTLVLEQGTSEVEYLYLIRRGGVKVFLTDAAGAVTLKDFRGEGGHFGALSIIAGSKANLSVATVEDTFCFLLDKDLFLTLVQSNPRVSQFYMKRFSEDLVNRAYAELRSRKRSTSSQQDAFYLFSVKVSDVLKRPAEIVPGGETIKNAAALMTRLGIGSLLVRDQSGGIPGVITDKDLRAKVVAMGLDYSTPVAAIMSSPVHRIPAQAVCFDALLQMMNEQVHHLAVERNNEIVGVITAHDIMVNQGVSPLYLFREIQAQRKIEGLFSLADKAPQVVRALVEEGAKANNVTRMITVLNDHISHKLLSLLQEEMGPAPYKFCWMTLGSEGRKEQTFKTDQDNALIYETPPDNWDDIKEGKLYFRRFGNKAIEYLERCGYPLCPGEIMASNPKWRKPYSVWKNYFDDWMNAPQPQEVLHATIFFDFRPGYGATELAESLRDYLCRQAPTRGLFLMHLARSCIQGRPPLTFFRNFIVEKDGKYKNRLDLKTRGLTPFVDFARLMALKHGLRETNTLARLQRLSDEDQIPRDLFSETREAYEFQMQLRLVHQMRMIEAGQAPNNYLDPAELTDLEKQTLKEAFAVIDRIRGYVKDEFRVVE
jgi:CBS domain-containing protein